ncbi:MAG: nitroreductase family protein [Anaerolineales bacterium]|nr:nitroreductase family protein [Anaerolineales bacterium]
MSGNPTIQTMLNRKSIRRYTDQPVADEIIHAIVRAGQQAPFAAQLYSVLLSRKGHHAFGAPLLFTICVDAYKLARIMEKRHWQIVSNDLTLLVFGIQDAALMAENMVTAGESYGLGSCFLGAAPYIAEKIAKQYKLPPRVFPLVQLVMGYPAENPPPRPRYPLEFTLFEDTYPELTDEMVEQAMHQMDEGYLAQDYYRKAGYIIPLEGEREESFDYDNYSWTEHISRKWGQWHRSLDEILSQLEKRGYNISKNSEP